MSHLYSRLNPPLQHNPNQKPWEKKWFAPTVVGFLALLLGIAVGTSGQPEPVEVVKEVPGPERVVTKEVTKEVTPKACLTALDLGEQGFTYSAEAMGYMGDALTAAGNFDVAALEKANSNLTTLNPKMKSLTAPMKAASSECRASAK